MLFDPEATNKVISQPKTEQLLSLNSQSVGTSRPAFSVINSTAHTVELGYNKFLETGKIGFLYPSFFYPEVRLQASIASNKPFFLYPIFRIFSAKSTQIIV